MAYDLIIFDCDGTLVDSEYLNNLALVQILADEGLPQYDMDHAYAHFVGSRLGLILENISAETDHIFPADTAKRCVDLVTQLMPEHLKSIPGANELVQSSAENGPICVGSNGQRDNVIESLRLSRLMPFFTEETIFTAEQVARPKPAPDLFLHAAAAMNAAREKTLVIEDTPLGVQAAIAAGMQVFGFTGTHKHDPQAAEKLQKAGASAVFDSLIHIQRVLFDGA